jgi:hypothetical protein
MVLVAKLALGLTGTIVLAGAYTFHDGVLHVDVDENQEGGHHVHVWAPAALVPMALHVVPDDKMDHTMSQVEPWLPTIRALSNELKKYPESEFVDVRDAKDHVQVRTHHGKLTIDVDAPDQHVHVACPLAMIDDVSSELASRAPGI